MQLQLTMAERQLLADILEEKRYALTRGAGNGGQSPERDLAKARECEEIFGKVVENHIQFSTDELDTIAAVLTDRDRELKEQGVSRENRQLLQSVIDKVVETCVMF